MNLNEAWQGIISVLLAIVGIAIVAVIVSQRSQTADVVSAAAKGFAADIEAAVSPISGSNMMGGMTLSTPGGASSIYNY
jgi:hypothetical protein